MKKDWILPLAIALLAVVILLSYWKLTKIPYLTFSDAGKFADVARQIYQGKGFSTNFSFFNPAFFFQAKDNLLFKNYWLSLSPLFLTLSFFLFGVGDKIVIFTSGFFFVLSAVLIYFLAQKLFGKMVGLLSAIAFIFTPSMLEYASLGASESLFILEIILTVYLLLFKKSLTIFFAGIIMALMFLTRQQASIYFLGFLILLWLSRKEKMITFLEGIVLILLPISLIGKITNTTFFGQQPLSLLFEQSVLSDRNITLRGGIDEFGLKDVFVNLKVLLIKVFYNLYNFYKSLPILVSAYLVTLYFVSLLRWNEEKGFRIFTLFILLVSLIAASLTIPFMRYLHPIVPLVIILAVEMLVYLVRSVVKNRQKAFLICLGFIFFFVIGQTAGQIFIDSRYLARTVNQDKPPINYLLGKMMGSETKPGDLIITNLDTWGSWYGGRKNIWLPFTPEQLIPPVNHKTKIDVIFLSSYLANDPAQALGEEWQKILDNPEKISDSFIKNNFYLAKKFKIQAVETYENQSVYGVILKRR